MDQELERRRAVCAAADNPEWDGVVARARSLSAAQKEFLRDHPPGLVRALWAHFEATRDRCGCATPTHEGRGCQVRLIEKLLLEQELD
jgi:hypothetical protein